MIKATLLGLNFLAFIAATPAFADSGTPPPDTRLKASMKVLGARLKSLGESVGDSSHNTANIQILNDMILETDASKAEIPPRISKIPESERAQFIKAYQEKLDQLKNTLSEVSLLLKDNKNAEAGVLMNQILLHRKEGHTQFK